MNLARKIVDGLLDPDPDNLETFTQGALTSNFGHFMRSLGKSWPDGVEDETFDLKIESDDKQVLVCLAVHVLYYASRIYSAYRTYEIRFYLTVKLKRWDAHYSNWDCRLRHLTPNEVAVAAQLTYQWLTGAVPAVINNRPPSTEAESHIPIRLQHQLQRAIHPLRKEPYEPPIA